MGALQSGHLGTVSMSMSFTRQCRQPESSNARVTLASPLLIGFKVKDYITLVHSLSKLVLIHQVMPFKQAPASKEFSSNSYNRKSC